MKLMISTIRRLLPCTLVVLAACAPLAPQQGQYPVGRAQMALPPGAWQDLEVADEAVAVLPAPIGRIALQTRAVDLRGAQQELLAVLRVQTNRDNYPRESVYWTGDCPRQAGVLVEDATQGSPVRVDCLRLKRWAGSAQWLEKSEPDFAQWLDRHKLALDKPYSYLSYRYASTGGALVQVEALVDQRLLTPPVRNNEEFLRAGRPALQWAHDLRQAVRVSAGMMNGYLAIPPFPMATPVP
ncbi:MAG: hypothetical protein KGM60_01150 [Comamonadaceae bacterium]|nr:hypothetical protein [Pseudomonadota bacterium]MBS0610631.1 hypothetical protein [Pseudomonadota bacterium]MDE2413345.1 hypothetical protein [Comamonadaceae bacterium]